MTAATRTQTTQYLTRKLDGQKQATETSSNTAE